MHEPFSIFSFVAGLMTRGVSIVVGLMGAGFCVIGLAMMRLGPSEPAPFRVVWIVFCSMFAGIGAIMALSALAVAIFGPRFIRRGTDALRAHAQSQNDPLTRQSVADGPFDLGLDTPRSAGPSLTCAHCGRTNTPAERACPGCGSTHRI